MAIKPEALISYRMRFEVVMEATRNAREIPKKLLQLERAVVILCEKARLRYGPCQSTDVIGAIVVSIGEPITHFTHHAVLEQLAGPNAKALAHVQQLHAAGRLYLLFAPVLQQADVVCQNRIELQQLSAAVHQLTASSYQQQADLQQLTASSYQQQADLQQLTASSYQQQAGLQQLFAAVSQQQAAVQRMEGLMLRLLEYVCRCRVQWFSRATLSSCVGSKNLQSASDVGSSSACADRVL
jgi:hypothetical protein